MDSHSARGRAAANATRINWRMILAVIWLATVYGSFLRHYIRGFLEKLGI
ncbi:MAG TPA: hypothetical protein VM223_06595 [Planctomycetota bacterium]|nr:hypothetical protein [Planctomycetota bacterium]